MKQDNCCQSTIVRYVENNGSGIQLLNLSRCAIGYVIRGSKHVYYGDTKHVIEKGEVFYLGVGNHYIEDTAEGEKPFEQIVVYYSVEQLQKILLHLNISYKIAIVDNHTCQRCYRQNHISTRATYSLRNFFHHVAIYLKEENFVHDQTAENIKITELIYLIVSQEDGCLKHKVLANADQAKDNFEQVIYNNILNDLSVEQLSSLTNRSLTSFKKEFKRHFLMPPHKWFIHQRLLRSRLLLISTTKSISEIGIECSFPNTSHFIKLFKKQYGTTPAIYRHLNTTISNQKLPAEQIILNAEVLERQSRGARA